MQNMCIQIKNIKIQWIQLQMEVEMDLVQYYTCNIANGHSIEQCSLLTGVLEVQYFLCLYTKVHLI